MGGQGIEWAECKSRDDESFWGFSKSFCWYSCESRITSVTLQVSWVNRLPQTKRPVHEAKVCGFTHFCTHLRPNPASNSSKSANPSFPFLSFPLFLVSNLLQIPQMLARFKVPSPMRWDEVGDNINKHQKLSKTYQTCIFTLLIFVLPQARYSISGLDYRNLTGCDSECFFKHSFFHMTLWINWGG